MNSKKVPQNEILAITDFLSQNDIPAKSRITFTIENHGCQIVFDNTVFIVAYNNNIIDRIFENGVVIHEKFDNLLAVLLEIITKETLITHCLVSCQNYYCTFRHPLARPQICSNLQCEEDKCCKIHVDGKERCVCGGCCILR
jgi:hypothetical protein